MEQVTQWVRSVSKELSYWIGLSDIKSEGNFIWESGRELSEDVSKFWNPNNPDNWNNEDCAIIYAWHWVKGHDGINDRLCEDVRRFVCQRRPGERSNPSKSKGMCIEGTIFSACNAQVDAIQLNSARDEAKKAQPHLFNLGYTKQPESFNGRPWYKSTDGVTILAYYPQGYWLLQPATSK